MSDDRRDVIGRVVREAWVRWARTQADPKPSWLVPYDELPEADKEADRQIAEAVLSDLNCRRIHLAEKKSRDGLTPGESDEFASLQRGVFDAIDVLHPGPPIDSDRLDRADRSLAADAAREMEATR